jgi:hypothetical protein
MIVLRYYFFKKLMKGNDFFVVNKIKNKFKFR